MLEDTQRILTAIIDADATGYSRLMGMIDADALPVPRVHRAELIDT